MDSAGVADQLYDPFPCTCFWKIQLFLRDLVFCPYIITSVLGNQNLTNYLIFLATSICYIICMRQFCPVAETKCYCCLYFYQQLFQLTHILTVTVLTFKRWRCKSELQMLVLHSTQRHFPSSGPAAAVCPKTHSFPYAPFMCA